MIYESMPLYPALRGDCERDACVRMPVFGGGGHRPGRPDMGERCRRVWIENPCRPGERAEVLLSVDDCGNLTVCVRRDPDCPPACARPCPPPCPPRPCARRGRLYGSW